VRLQLHALAYNLGNFLRTLTLPEAVGHWSMTTLRDRLVKIGAKIVRYGRSFTFQMAEVMVPRTLVRQILDAIAALRPLQPARCCVPPQSPAGQTLGRGLRSSFARPSRIVGRTAVTERRGWPRTPSRHFCR
jgi:hypothetical protein